MKRLTSYLTLLLALTVVFSSCSKDDKIEEEIKVPEAVANALADDFVFDDVELWTGTGEKKAVFIVEWADEKKPDQLAWGYKFDGEIAAFDMISAIVKVDKRLTLLTHDTNYGKTIAGLGYVLDGDADEAFLTFDGDESDPHYPDENGLVFTDSYDYDDWGISPASNHWKSGWMTNGFWNFFHKDNLKDEWTFASLGVSNLKLDKDGSMVYMVFKPFN